MRSVSHFMHLGLDCIDTQSSLYYIVIQDFMTIPVVKKRKNDVWLKMLLGTCLLESLKANTKDGTEKSKESKKEIMSLSKCNTSINIKT